MIIDIDVRVQLDKHEFEATTALIRDFVEHNRHVTKIELASDDVHRQTSDGVFDYIDRVGMRVKVQAHGKIGVDAVMALLEKLGAETYGEIIGQDGSACEPLTRDRLFYKPKSFTMPNGEVRHFSPPSPFEPCPGSHRCNDVVKATHPEPPSTGEPSSERTSHETD